MIWRIDRRVGTYCFAPIAIEPGGLVVPVEAAVSVVLTACLEQVESVVELHLQLQLRTSNVAAWMMGAFEALSAAIDA